MTTHEARPEMETAAGRDERPEMESGMGTIQPETGQPESVEQSAVSTDTAPHAQQPTHATGSGDRMLFADAELSQLRSRWTEVQAQFVDDPRDCVQKADGLVADVVDRLTSGFAQARSGLEEQWSRGEEASTEDLRIALQRYRDFFERLLAV